jgi:8-oxo-dGTP pyrophosphatase MutT (NUDIX family)
MKKNRVVSTVLVPEIIARGVCVQRGHVLLCRNRKRGNVYLPGGHLEGEERAPDALARELLEELGLRCRIGKFLGMIQHAFDHKGERVVEINFVFAFQLPKASLARPPVSVEEKIEFYWWPLAKLTRAKLQPHILPRILPAWLRGGSQTSRWTSTF